VSSTFEPEFGKRGELRQRFGETGRVHIDRWLPFLVLYRGGRDHFDIARRVAVNCPAYIRWSAEDDDEARSVLEVVKNRLQEHLGRILVFHVCELDWSPGKEDSAELPPFEIRVSASGSEAARAAAEAFKSAAGDVCIDLRRPEVRCAAFDEGGPDRLKVEISPIHRGPDGLIYPQLTHDLAVALIDSLLRSAAAFMGAASGEKPPHFRSLGRSAVLAAALNADKKLDSVCRRFDFLLSLTPINTDEARKRFFESGCEREPEFRYRPLTVDPDAAKRDLYDIDLSILEDPLLERLLVEKRRETDVQLTMLAARNTPGFQAASILLYGAVSPELLNDAHSILSSVEPEPPRGETVGARYVAEEARGLIRRYQARDERFDTRVEVRDDVAGLLVSADRLCVSATTEMRGHRVDALLAHEVSVHLLTWCNGASQPLSIFRTGLAGYEGVQEGLGVFAEWAVGGLTATRLRLLAGRVVAVAAMLDGASFIDVFRRLTGDFGFPRKTAFDISMRVFRSGGFAKDSIYLRGFREVVDHVAAGKSLDPFWLGKIAPHHVEAIEELRLRNLLIPPVFVPEFMEREDSKRRIGRLGSGLTFDKLLELE